MLIPPRRSSGLTKLGLFGAALAGAVITDQLCRYDHEMIAAFPVILFGIWSQENQAHMAQGNRRPILPEKVFLAMLLYSLTATLRIGIEFLAPETSNPPRLA